MNTDKAISNRGFKTLEIGIFLIAGVLIAMYVYIANDETQPLLGIFRLEYLIPTLIYTGLAILLCLSLNYLLNKLINRTVALILSLLLGFPISMFLLINLGQIIL